MNYDRIYKEIVDNALGRDHTKIGYKERHHIIPKCMNGTDEYNNLVYLTAREHFLAHWLLVKIYPNNTGLIHGFNVMCVDSYGNRNLNTHLYKYARERVSKLYKEKSKGTWQGKDNPMYGKSFYDVWLNKHGKEWTDNRLKEYSDNMRKATHGKHLTSHTEEAKEKVRKSKRKIHKITYPNGHFVMINTTALYICKNRDFNLSTVRRFINKSVIPNPLIKNPTQDKLNCVGFRIDSYKL